MKNRNLVYSWIFMIGIVSSCQNKDLNRIYQDEHFDTVIDRNLALQEYAKKAQQSTGKEREKYLIKFFNAFPSDFETYFKMEYPCYGDTLYAIKNEEGWKKEGWYLEKSFFKNPWGRFFPVLCIVNSEQEIPKEVPSRKFKDFDLAVYSARAFHRLGDSIPYTILYDIEDIVPEEIFYRKMISVQIGAFDALSQMVKGFTAYSFPVHVIRPFLTRKGLIPKYLSELEKRLDPNYKSDIKEEDILDNQEMETATLILPDVKPIFIKILEEKTDDEICAFWYGRYRLQGGAAPINSAGNWQATYNSLVKVSPRIANLMRKACDKILENVREGGNIDKDMKIKVVTLAKL
eukprot:gene5045-6278_t